MSDIEHELIATLWDLKVAKDRIDKLTKSNLQLREGCEELKQRIKRLEDALAWYETKVSDCNRQGPEGDAARDALAKDYGRKAKEAKP